MSEVFEPITGHTPVVTCHTSPNIAIIKYWGKANEHDVIPLNDSLSVTLKSEQLKTTTCVYVNHATQSQEDVLIVNGERTALNGRTRALFGVLREKSTLPADVITKCLTVVSTNNFPTASGMASSASGFAALAHALCHYLQVKGDWSVYARMGSGSACRSMLGGFVQWERGTCSEDSKAVQLFDENHWPQLRVLILIFSSQQKSVSSTAAMKRSVETSSFLKKRVQSLCEEKTMQKLQTAIADRDFETFATICMQESNQLHAVCMDTYPPVMYLTDESRLLIHSIHELNEKSQRTLAAYSFDAGPNAFIFFQEKDKSELYCWLQHKIPSCHLTSRCDENGKESPLVKRPKSVCMGEERIVPHIECTVGPGPTLQHT